MNEQAGNRIPSDPNVSIPIKNNTNQSNGISNVSNTTNTQAVNLVPSMLACQLKIT